MSKVKIVTDSACNMLPGIAEKLKIEIVSLTVMIDGVIYKDSELSSQQFMTMMENAKALPKTSQPPIGEFIEMYDKLGEDGSSIISIHVTELLSGTVNTARQAAQMSKSDVTVIDSTFADQGIAFQVVRAAEMALEEATKEEIISEVKKIKKNSLLYIGIATLENMVKGGRLSRATGVFTHLFNIRVVMQLLDSELVTQTKGRGAKAFTKWFDDFKLEVAKMTTTKKIAIAHADALDLATQYKNSLLEIFPSMDISVVETTSTIATHTGKGAFSIMLYTE